MQSNFKELILQDGRESRLEGFAPLEQVGAGRWRWALGPRQRLCFNASQSANRLQYRIHFPRGRTTLLVQLNGQEISRISSVNDGERIDGFFDFTLTATTEEHAFDFTVSIAGAPLPDSAALAYSVERFRSFPLLPKPAAMAQAPADILRQGLPTTFCPLPFVSFFVGVDGNSYPCCESVPAIAEDAAKAGELRRIQDPADVEQAWNSSVMQEIRLDLVSGRKASACQNCFKLEEVGARSRRQQMLEFLLEPATEMVAHMDRDGKMHRPPAMLDLQVGNLCNLRCRMCGPIHSVNLVKEFSELYREDYSSYRNNYWHGNQRLLETLAAQTGGTSHIFAIGGELLLSPDFLTLLERVIALGHAGSIELMFNTNLTKLPEKVFAKFREFKSVHLMVSLEATGSLNDYIRYPSKFETVDENLRLLHDQPGAYHVSRVSFNTTVQIYNVLELPKLFRHLRDSFPRFDWFPQLSVLHRPEPLSALVLKPEHREIAIRGMADFLTETRARKDSLGHRQLEKMEEEIAACVHFLRGPDLSHLTPEFHNINKVYDRHREKVHELRIPGITV